MLSSNPVGFLPSSSSESVGNQEKGETREGGKGERRENAAKLELTVNLAPPEKVPSRFRFFLFQRGKFALSSYPLAAATKVTAVWRRGGEGDWWLDWPLYNSLRFFF